MSDGIRAGAVRDGASGAATPDDPPVEDLDRLEQALLDNIAALEPAATLGDREQPIRRGSALTGAMALELFEAQLLSRHVDHTARWLRKQGAGFYTIGSAGHEGNAAVAAALRPTDPALLHYRSGGFYLARTRQVPGHDGVRDMLAGMLALADEPIAGGRHKVFGHPDLAVIPQTSTIASHLPRAVGVAFAIGRAKRLGVPTAWPVDALAICSFGDASANHSTSQGAINAARYTAHQGLPLPLLFVCEDNGWGISVPTPSRWIETAFGDIGELRYEWADGSNLADTYDVARDLAGWVRTNRRPAFLHLRTVRFMGHAGTDVESGYRSAASIRDDELRDPILGTARLIVDAGLRTPAELCAQVLSTRTAVREQARSMVGGPTLTSADGGDGAVVAAPSGRRPRTRRSGGRRRLACRVLRRQAARVGGTAHARRDDQPHPRRPARGAA